MNTVAYIKSISIRVAVDLVKGTAASLGAMVGLILGGVVVKIVGLPSPVIPAYMNMAIILPLLFISGIPMAILLGECFQRLPFNFGQRVVTAWVCHYILYYLANLLDAFLYSPMQNMSTSILSDLFPSLGMALIIAWLWRPAKESPVESWSSLLKKGTILPGFAWRMALAWACYPPIYYLIGLLVIPFTKSYYDDPSHSLGLTAPTLAAVWLMQIPRGILFIIAVLPIILNWRGSQRMTLWMWVVVVIFLQIANTVMFQAYWLPVNVRLPHTIELLVDSSLQAGAYILLFTNVKPKIYPQGQEIHHPHARPI
jgi:hypothetical protein